MTKLTENVLLFMTISFFTIFFPMSILASTNNGIGAESNLQSVVVKSSNQHKTITGLVYPMVSDDLGLGDDFLRKHDIVVELRATYNTPAESGLSTTAVFVGDDQGRFTIENVPFGDYLLYIKRPGYLARCMMITVSPSDADIIELTPPSEEGRFDLWFGDVNDDFVVDNLDIMMVIEYMELEIDALSPDYNPACDLNADGMIDNLDIMMIIENFNKDVTEYPGAEDVEFFDSDIGIPKNILDLKCISSTKNSITLSWKASKYATKYEIKYGDKLISTSDTSITLEGLLEQTEYKISVRGISDEQVGNWAYITVITSKKGKEIIFEAVEGKSYDIVLEGDNIIDLSKNTFTIKYNPEVLELIDLASQTPAIDKTIGLIKGTDIEVISIESGKVELKLNKNVSQEQAWSGIVSIIKFKGLKAGSTSVTLE